MLIGASEIGRRIGIRKKKKGDEYDKESDCKVS